MKYRVRFCKHGVMRYIAHLDVMRYFQKILRRAELPVRFSEGFSPHMILSFAFPLSVGYTSDGEYFDVELTERVDEKEFVRRVNLYANRDLYVLSARELPEDARNCMAAVFASEYRISLRENVLFPGDFGKCFHDFFGQETIPVNKPKKKGGGFIPVDLKTLIYDHALCNDGEYSFKVTLNSSSSDNVRPAFVASAFLNSTGLEIEPGKEASYFRVHRLEIYENAGGEQEILLVPLIPT